MNNLKKTPRIMLEINRVSKKFGPLTAVDDFTLKLDKPGLYVFVGANGSGKSTLFNLMAGFILPDSGGISLNGTSDADKRRTFTGIASEPFFTEPALTLESITSICASLKKAGANDVNQWLTFWELDDKKNKLFKNLSTGMKKRLSLALSMIGNPKLLLWDEPFNGLDPLGIELLNKLTERLVSEGKYIFLSTHLLNEVTFAGEVEYLLLNQGRFIGKISSNTKNYRETILKLLKEKHVTN